MKTAYYRVQTLETIARKALTQFNPNYLNLSPQAVPIEKIIEDVFGITIEYRNIAENGEELGHMIYNDGYDITYSPEKQNYEIFRVKAKTMLIEPALATDPKLYGRLRFTLAHELAHWLLHQMIFEGTGLAAAMSKKDVNDDVTEWQANYLATAILMPNGQIKRGFYSIREQYKTINSQISTMAKIFEVSKQAMQYRLQGLGLL